MKNLSVLKIIYRMDVYLQVWDWIAVLVWLKLMGRMQVLCTGFWSFEVGNW
jgi:hypothetical protein